MSNNFNLYKTMEIDFDSLGFPQQHEYISVPIPTHCLWTAVTKGIIENLIRSLELWEDEVLSFSDSEDSPDDNYTREYMIAQFGLSLLTVDSEWVLDNETKNFLKHKFLYTDKAYNRYMDDMFFRCNSSDFDKVYKNDVEWNEDFDVEKEKQKPFLLYFDWLKEKDEEGVTNYDKYVKDVTYDD